MLRATWCTDVNEYGGWGRGATHCPKQPDRIRCACGLCHCASHWNELTVYFVCSLPTLRVAGFYRYERVRGLLLNVGALHFTSFHVLYPLVVVFLLCATAAGHVEIHNQASSFVCSYVIYMESVIDE